MNKDEVYCKNCKYYQYNSFELLFSGYSGKSPHRCMRNVEKKRNQIGNIVIRGDKDCFIINADLHCKYFEQKQKWYQKLFNTLKLNNNKNKIINK